MKIDELLRIMIEKKASDLHLMVKNPPVFRIDGKMTVQEDLTMISVEATRIPN